jgi:hypothetical protein
MRWRNENNDASLDVPECEPQNAPSAPYRPFPPSRHFHRIRSFLHLHPIHPIHPIHLLHLLHLLHHVRREIRKRPSEGGEGEPSEGGGGGRPSGTPGWGPPDRNGWRCWGVPFTLPRTLANWPARYFGAPEPLVWVAAADLDEAMRRLGSLVL